jgi:hypothetical protein
VLYSSRVKSAREIICRRCQLVMIYLNAIYNINFRNINFRNISLAKLISAPI